MHDSAMRLGALFFKSYLSADEAVSVLDVGGLDVNGSLRDHAPPGWSYTAVDMAPGKGVDVVLDDPYALPFDSDSFDGVVSTSCFEHDALFWLSFLEIVRVTKPGGYVYINAPSNGHVHRYPIDAWRFYPDAGLALVEWGKRSGVDVTLCESFISDPTADWQDFVTVFRKGAFTASSARPIYSQFRSADVRALGFDGVLNPQPHPTKSWFRRFKERWVRRNKKRLARWWPKPDYL